MNGRLHTTLTRELDNGDEIEIEVAYDCRGGSPRTYNDPGEAPEVSVISATGPDGKTVELEEDEEDELLEGWRDAAEAAYDTAMEAKRERMLREVE